MSEIACFRQLLAELTRTRPVLYRPRRVVASSLMGPVAGRLPTSASTLKSCLNLSELRRDCVSICFDVGFQGAIGYGVISKTTPPPNLPPTAVVP